MLSSMFDEIRGIKEQKLSSEMPETFTATVLAASKTTKKGGTGEGKPMLKLELQLEDGATFSENYAIPKAWTGKGQLDMLKEKVEKCDLSLDQVVGKTFKWQLIDIGMGHPRHYPSTLVKKGKTT